MTSNWEDFMKQVQQSWHETRAASGFTLGVHDHPQNFPLRVAVELIHKQGVELERLNREVEALREVIGSKL